MCFKNSRKLKELTERRAEINRRLHRKEREISRLVDEINAPGPSANTIVGKAFNNVDKTVTILDSLFLGWKVYKRLKSK